MKRSSEKFPVSNEYLLSVWAYNDWAFSLTHRAVGHLSVQDECLQLLSHLVYSQEKWFARINGNDSLELKWFGTSLPYEYCLEEWLKSSSKWKELIDSLSVDQLNRIVKYEDTEGGFYISRIKEIALQLNYHCIHHRAQVNYLIRLQGHTPPDTQFITFIKEELT